MLTTQHTSAGVYFVENDRGAQTQLVAGGVATAVLPLPRGRVGKNMRVTAAEFDDLIGPATGRYWQNVELLRLLVSQASYLNVTRIADGVKYAGTMISTFNNFAVSRPLAAGLDSLDTVQFSSKDILLVAEKFGGNGGNEYYIAYEPNTTDPDHESFNLYLYRVGFKAPVKAWRGCTLFYKVNGNNEQCFVEEMVNNDPLCPVMVFVNEQHYKLATDPKYPAINAVGGGAFDPNNPTQPHGQLQHGFDGGEIDIYHTDPAIRNKSLSLILEGWENYRDWERVRLGIACDCGYAHPAITTRIAEIAEERQDAIANANVPVQWQYPSEAIAYRYGRRKLDDMSLNIASSYLTLNANDVDYRATSVQRNMWVPFSVCMTYAMLECDKDRSWLAPAGLNRGGLPWALGLRHTTKVDLRDQYNDNSINFPIHFKHAVAANDALGIFVWNADTTYNRNSPLDDIGVRRLLCVITESARVSLLRYNFKNDSTVLRKGLQTDIEENILQPAQNGRGLDWYETVVDSRNNTAQTSAAGDLYIDIFLDPTRYTKRIHLNLNIAPTGQLSAVVNLIERGQV